MWGEGSGNATDKDWGVFSGRTERSVFLHDLNVQECCCSQKDSSVRRPKCTFTAKSIAPHMWDQTPLTHEWTSEGSAFKATSILDPQLGA